MTAHINQARRGARCALAAILVLAGARASTLNEHVELRPEAVVLKQDNLRLPVSLGCPKFTVNGTEVGTHALPAATTGALETGKSLEVLFAPISLADSNRFEVKLHIAWSAAESVLRKWASYRLAGSGEPKLVSEVVLEDQELSAVGVRTIARQPVNEDRLQSRPVFLEGFFAGIEYPIAQARVDNGRLRLSHQPGVRIRPGGWYETRKAVYGITPIGDEWNGFKRYIEAHRPSPKGSHHFLYNPFWSTPTTPSQMDIQNIMHTIRDKMYKPYGVPFDSYGLTVFTTEPKSIWQVDKKRFPRGFTDLQAACSEVGSHLDIFLSPSAVYPPALDQSWAGEQGYETREGGGLCLAGRRYQSETKAAIVDTVVRYDANHVFVDAYLFDCASTSHGHEPGALSREAVADGMIDIFKALRQASPNVWLAPTCFHWNASPWWNFYVHSVIGCYGDDAPPGRVPSPMYRDTYTSARDYFNLQGAYWLTSPIAATESFGIIHQSNYPLLNDAVTDILRGNMEQHCAINPIYMTDLRWRHLASVMRWARQNVDILQTTEPLLPRSWQNGRCPQFTPDATMPREPYGYAHWSGERGLVMLRNPWIEPQSYTVEVGMHGETKTRPGTFSAVSIYPERRIYGNNLAAGDDLEVRLAPYETVVLSFDKAKPSRQLQKASKAIRRHLKAKVIKCETSVEKFEGSGAILQPDATVLTGAAETGIRVKLDAEVSANAPDSDLLILLEDKQSPIDPICEVRINGREATLASGGSETGWAATVMPKPESWLFLTTSLPTGKSRVNLNLLTRGGRPVVSAWVWAKKAGITNSPTDHAVLPQPEIISLDGINLLRPIDLTTAAKETKTAPAPVERINGVFLDAMEPTRVRALAGGFLRNTNAVKTPLTICGRRYARGLGANASLRLAVSLNGEFRRFQSWVGLDSIVMANYMDRSAVVCEVWTDGEKRWESGVLRNTDPPELVKWVDVDVTGAKNLELRVIAQDRHGHFAQNLTDWAEARLLK